MGDCFEVKGQLSALSSEGFDLRVGGRDFDLEALALAIHISEAFLALGELVAKLRRRGYSFHDRSSALFDLKFDRSEIGGGGGRILFTQVEFVLSRRQVGGGGFKDLAVGGEFRLESGQTASSPGEFGVGGS